MYNNDNGPMNLVSYNNHWNVLTRQSNCLRKMATPCSVSVQYSINQDKETVLLNTVAANVMSKLPKPVLEKIDKRKVDRILTEAQSLSLLVTGRSGVGKSTIINGVLGMKIGDKEFAEESGNLSAPGSRNVKPFTKKMGQIDVTVWDSRGLLDGTQSEVQDRCLREMAQRCSGVDLKLFCIQMTQMKFTCSPENSDAIAILKLTQAFGEEFWSNVVVILTFANFIEHHPEYIDLDASEKATKFAARVDEWRVEVHKVLVTFAGIPEEKAKEVKVIPAGHSKVPHLPDRQFWLGDLWLEILDALPTDQAQGALLDINAERLIPAEEVGSQSLQVDELHTSPIVITTRRPEYHNKPPLLSKVLTIAGCAGAGAAGGAAVGLAAVVGGPVVVAIAMPTCLVLGACIGIALGYYKNIEEEKTKKIK